MSKEHHTSPADSHSAAARQDDARWEALDAEQVDEHDFWGDQAEWPTAAIPVVTHEGAAPAAGSAAPEAESPRTREHRVVRTSTVAPRRGRDDQAAPAHAVPASAPILDQGVDDTPVAPVWDDRWAPAEPARVAGVDPRIFRLGAAAVIVTLLVPLLAGLRSGNVDDFSTLATAELAAVSTDAGAAIEDASPTAPAGDETPVTIASADAESAPAADDVSDRAADVEPGEADAAGAAGSVESGSDVQSDGAPADADGSDGGTESAVAAEQLCPVDYEVRGGDFWLRLADGAGVELAEVLDANDATVNTPLYPGRTVCLPAGSKTPPPPASNAGSAGSSGSSSGGSSGSSAGGSSSGSSGGSQPTPTTAPKPAPTTPPTTAAPATTAPPPPPPPPPAPAQVEQIIRSVWPDDLEEKALRIAWRESNYKADVRNYCCFGLFQIYWSVHQSWLRDMGVTSAGQLYDAETNTRAAYALYQRAGGWGPWGG